MRGFGLGLGLRSAAASVAAAPVAAFSLSPDLRPGGLTYRRYFTGPITPHQQYYTPAITESTDPSPLPATFGVQRNLSSATICVTAHGDSLTWGVQAESWLTKMERSHYTATGRQFDYKNRGLPGHSFAYAYTDDQPTLIADAAAQVDAVLANGKTNWLVVWAGTNGIANGSHSAATEIADATTYINARISAGWTAAQIIIVTMLPRGSGGTLVSEVTRTSFNNGLVSLASSTGCVIAPVHSNANIGVAGQQSSSYFAGDTIHLSDSGQKVARDVIYGVMPL